MKYEIMIKSDRRLLERWSHAGPARLWSFKTSKLTEYFLDRECGQEPRCIFCFCCGSHWLMNWLGLQQIWKTPFGCSCSDCRTGSRKLIARPLEKPPQQSQTVELVDQRRAEIWPCGMLITPVRLEMRSGGGRKMSHKAAFCLGECEIWRLSGLPGLLCRDEEAGSHTGGKQGTQFQTQCWGLEASPSFLLAAGSPANTQPPCCEYFPIDVFTFSNARRGRTFGLFPRWWFPSDQNCQNRPPPIREHSGPSDTDDGDSSCRQLAATTCLFWSLPLRRGDSERWGSMWPGAGSRAPSQRGAAHTGQRCSWQEERAG